MLMLIITVVLAAVISGYTGGLAKTQQKPPTLVFEANIVNDDGAADRDRFLDINVISISEGIPSRDLKFQTEWKNQSGSIQHQSLSYSSGRYPQGYGMGNNSPNNFGNYTILAGTRLHANGTEGGMEEVLGPEWKNMSLGTPVRLQFIHVPSSAIIADKEITSE